MQNPILQAMQAVNNPNKMIEDMLNSNPMFREFYNANKDKSMEQVAQQYGIDPNMVKQLIGSAHR